MVSSTSQQCLSTAKGLQSYTGPWHMHTLPRPLLRFALKGSWPKAWDTCATVSDSGKVDTWNKDILLKIIYIRIYILICNTMYI